MQQTATSMHPKSLPLTEAQRLQQSLRSIAGYLEANQPQRALGVAKKALNECEGTCAKRNSI